MNISLRQAACALALSAVCACALAQAAFPARPVSIMVPYPAGSASDLTARTLSEGIGKSLGGTVIVENLGGAAGALAASKVLAAPADGHYLFQGSPSELILSPLLNRSTRYKPDDFELVAAVAASQLVIVVSSQLAVNSVDELVELARSRKGQPLTYGSPGPGTLYHVLGELFSKRTGATTTHVPYKGGAPVLQDLLGGQIDFAFTPFQSTYADYVKQGRLKLIGTLSDKRLPTPFESVRPVAESRPLRDFNFDIWTAYLVRKGTPRTVVERMRNAVATALKEPQARAQLEAQAKNLYEPMSLEAGEKFYAREIVRYRDLVKAVGIEPQ